MIQTDDITKDNSSNKKKKILLIVKILVSIVILYYLIDFIDFRKIQATVKDADIVFILFAVLLLPLNLFFQFKKWEFVCNSLLNIKNKKRIWFSIFYGISGGLVTPLQTGEYITRAMPFKDISIIKVAFATAVDKFYPLLIVSFVGSILSLQFLHYYFGIPIFLAVFGLIVVFSVFMFLLFLIFREKSLESRLFQKLNKIKFLRIMKDELNEVRKLDKIFSIKMFGLSTLLILTYSFQFMLVISAFTHQFYLSDYFWFVILVLFAKTILPPITFGEIGIREAASVYFGSYFGIPEAAAFNAAMVLFLINLMIPSLIGLTLFMVKTE